MVQSTASTSALTAADQRAVMNENSLTQTIENLKGLVESKQILIEQLLDQKRDLSSHLSECRNELDNIRNTTLLDLQASNVQLQEQLKQLKDEKNNLSKKFVHLQASQVQPPSLQSGTS